MIEYIYGKIEYKGKDYLVINNGNIGYKILASLSTLSKLELGSNSKVYTDMVVREDDISLYGFYSEDEREVYRLLITVKGIGPKMAIGALSGMDSELIINAIRSQDVAMLTKVPGIGKKTAERVILELKDKTENIQISGETQYDSTLIDAEEALVQLGYSSYEVSTLLNDIYKEGMTIEDIIRLALKEMTR